MRHQLFTLFALLSSLPAAAWDVRTDSEGDVVKWTHPLELVLTDRADELLHAPGAMQAIAAAFKHVDDATPALGVSLRVGKAQDIGYVVGQENQNSVLVLEDWPYAEEALAVTLVTLNARTNELLDADVAFNTGSHRFRVLPDTTRDERQYDDVQNTITHELGHVLGLMHNRAEEDVVMFPSAPPGEIIKRALKQDDRDGLLSLYSTADVAPTLPESVPVVGCSGTGGPPMAFAFAALLLASLRRRRAALALACVPALAFASEPQADVVSRAADVALVQVSSRRSFTHPQHPGLILTELTFAGGECLKGACAQLTRVVVPGGRLGDLEQVVVHSPVPVEGEQVVVARVAGQPRLLWLEADARQQLVLRLRSAGSAGPQTSAAPPTTAGQVRAITP